MLRRSVPPVNNPQISNSGSLEANFHRALAPCPVFSANPRRVVQSLVGKKRSVGQDGPPITASPLSMTL
jgi:hypothetical protein